jgi:hypothetical protein
VSGVKTPVEAWKRIRILKINEEQKGYGTELGKKVRSSLKLN